MPKCATDLAAITRMFSSTVFRELARTGRSSLFRRLAELSNLPICIDSSATVGDVFDSAFALLKTSGNRDEYVYRSALTQKILLGRHSLRTASMLSEFRVGRRKADLVILNGTSTAYEIKSERDSLVRLEKQVEMYKRVFAEVNVIASECHIDRILSLTPEDVGVLCLSKRYQISTVREAIEEPNRIYPSSVLDCLRTDEAMSILNSLEVDVPEVPNTMRRKVLKRAFSDLDPTTLHRQMVRTLKYSRSLAPYNDLVLQLPSSLHAAALSIPIRQTERARLVKTINDPFTVTREWI